MTGNVWEWTADRYSPRGASTTASASPCCRPPINPQTDTPARQLRHRPPRRAHPAPCDQRRLAPLRAELLPALPARRTPTRIDRHLHEPHRIPLRDPLTRRDSVHRRGHLMAWGNPRPNRGPTRLRSLGDRASRVPALLGLKPSQVRGHARARSVEQCGAGTLDHFGARADNAREFEHDADECHRQQTISNHRRNVRIVRTRTATMSDPRDDQGAA
jgi:hypothetical protein